MKKYYKCSLDVDKAKAASTKADLQESGSCESFH